MVTHPEGYSTRSSRFAALVALATAAMITGCKGDPGTDGTSCTVTQNTDGSATISCDDGTTATVANGVDGTDCTLDGNTLTCGTDTWTIENGQNGDPGDPGDPGTPGLNAGESPGIDLNWSINTPSNGTFFAAGEHIVVSFDLADDRGVPLTLADFSTLNIYMYGPQDMKTVTTPVAMMGTTADRSASVHHYVNLKNSPTGLVVSGSQLTYTMNAVGSEPAGTYKIGLRAAVPNYPFDTVFDIATVQIGTATVEGDIVHCESCHQADNGQFYMHHVDPGFSPTGSPDLDAAPITTCLACHNNDGYASVRKCDDDSVPTRVGTAYKCDDGTTNWSYVSDHIVRRVHGLHHGDELADPYNLQDFEAYTTVHFPAGASNCAWCHSNDNWKTKPSRQACGACHDTVDFATGTNHGDGGIQTTDNDCLICHGAGKTKDIAVMHAATHVVPTYDITLAMSEPDSGTFYTDEAPDVTISFKLHGTSTVVNPDTTFVEAYKRIQFFVYGPRDHAVPVLTTAAEGSTEEYSFNDLRKMTNPDARDPRAEWSSTAITYHLDSVDGLEPGTYMVFIRTQPNGGTYSFAWTTFQVGTDTEQAKAALQCTDCHADTGMHSAEYPFDTDICLACHDFRQFDGGELSSGWDEDNAGFGVPPLPRIIHQVHFGHYLNSTTQFEDIIFPQDVRSCTTCHAETDSYKTEPSRLACLACHDEADGIAHGSLMTVDPTPATPYSGDEAESCGVCHETGKEFGVDTVHNISDPYVPPYPREPVAE